MQKAAIFVSNVERLQEGLLAGKSLALNGMQVQILLTDSTATPAETGNGYTTFKRPPRGTQRFTNHLDVADRFGFRYATLAQIALMLKEADVVIPF